MLTGYIKDDKPFIPIDVGLGQNVQTLIALVDTGFTGELKMPNGVAQSLGITTNVVKDLLLGNSEPIPHGVGRVHVAMEKMKKEVEVLVGKGPILLGVKLLRNFGYTLKMDFAGNIFYLERAEETDPFHFEE